jgi:hypothetical protein
VLRRGLLQLKARAEAAERETDSLKASMQAAEKQRAAEVEKAVAAALLSQEKADKDKALSAQAAQAARLAATANGSSEWRLALGELGSNLRREIADRPTRSEMESGLARGWAGSPAAAMVSTVAALDASVTELRKTMSQKCDSEELGKAWHDLRLLQSRVASEMTGGLWLWTSRQLIGAECTVPWDNQLVNAAPAGLLWRRGSGIITVRLAGLYRMTLAVFTQQPVKVTVCLNDEPLLVTYPESLGSQGNPEEFSMTAYLNAALNREDKYIVRRLRHSAGEVTAVSIEETLNLPADAVLTVRFQSPLVAQALLSLRKL